MTQRSEVYHEIGCGADAYWRCVFDKEYNRRLHLEAYKYESYELIEQEETDTEIKRVFTFKPKMTEMPKPLRKLMEGLADPSSTEECVFDKKAGRMSVLWKPKMLSERLFMKATVSRSTSKGCRWSPGVWRRRSSWTSRRDGRSSRSSPTSSSPKKAGANDELDHEYGTR